ncbi:MAG TPA: diguanylate cyclase [Mobilitalea sp.]|nr:diguanylate cyclase [Mobilitalea sp.]
MKHYGTNFLLAANQPNALESVNIDKLLVDRSRLSFYEHYLNNVSFDTFNSQTSEPNQFIEAAQGLLKSKNNKNSYTMVVFDIDQFRNVNEFYGYPAGNELLYYIGVKLASKLEASNLFCRLCDDNYAVFLENYREIDIALLVIHLTEEISNYYPELQLKLSFGICRAEQSDVNITSLCSRAYYAKSTIKGKLQLLANYDEVIINQNLYNIN